MCGFTYGLVDPIRKKGLSLATVPFLRLMFYALSVRRTLGKTVDGANYQRMMLLYTLLGWFLA